MTLTRLTGTVRNNVARNLNPYLLRLFCNGIDPTQTLVIAGSNRSGTTWVQEMVASLPNTVSLFEPCHVDVITEAREAGIHKLIYREPEAHWPEGQRYLQRVLSGQCWHRYTAFLNSPLDCFRPRRLVVKFIHANGILNWMTHHFPIPSPLVIVRHPGAVVSSVLNLKWNTEELSRTFQQSELVQRSNELREYIQSLTTPLEQLTARWCLENAVLFNRANQSAMQRVTYESLLLGGPDAMAKIFQNWNLPVPASLEERFHKDSKLSASNRSYADIHARLSRWKKDRGQSEVRRMLEIVHDFGLDFYSEDPVPDEDRFRNCQAHGLLSSDGRLRVAA